MRTVRVRVATTKGIFNTLDRAFVDSDQLEREMVLEMDWLSDGTVVVLYRLRGDSLESLESLLETSQTVIHADAFEGEQPGELIAFVHMEPESPMSELLSLVDRHGLLINRPISVTDGGVEVHVAGTEASIQSAMAELPADIEFSIEHASDGPATDRSPRSRLTNRQREAVEVAIELGYYETPRQATYEDIADRLDCAPSTANELLRRAESTLVTTSFGV